MKHYHDKYDLIKQIPDIDLEMVQKKLAKDLRSRRSLKSIHGRFLKLFQNFHPLFKKDDPLKQVKDQKEKQKAQNPTQHSVDILRSIWETNFF